MTNDLGVWTADDCALVLIDYQKEMFEVIRSETSADLVEMHVRLLARTAKAFDMPIVLTTVGVGAGFNGPTLPSILSELDGIEPIDRYSMSAFENPSDSEQRTATVKRRMYGIESSTLPVKISRSRIPTLKASASSAARVLGPCPEESSPTMTSRASE